MRNIKAASLCHGDTLVSIQRGDTFTVLDGEYPDIFIIECENGEGISIRGVPYNVGSVMRSWIRKNLWLSGDYEIYRNGSLLSATE